MTLLDDIISALGRSSRDPSDEISGLVYASEEVADEALRKDLFRAAEEPGMDFDLAMSRSPHFGGSGKVLPDKVVLDPQELRNDDFFPDPEELAHARRVAEDELGFAVDNIQVGTGKGGYRIDATDGSGAERAIFVDDEGASLSGQSLGFDFEAGTRSVNSPAPTDEETAMSALKRISRGPTILDRIFG